MQHSEQACKHFCSECCIMKYGTGALWDLWITSIHVFLFLFQEGCTRSRYQGQGYVVTSILHHSSFFVGWNITMTSHKRHGISNYWEVNRLFKGLYRSTTRKYQSTALLAPCERDGNHRWRWILLIKDQLRGNPFRVLMSWGTLKSSTQQKIMGLHMNVCARNGY